MPFPLLLLILTGLIAAPRALERKAVDVSLHLLAEAAAPEAPEDGEIIEVSILALREVRYRPGRPLPQWVKNLDGKRVSIWGHMAINTLEGQKGFELVPESCECNRSKLNHFVDVTLTEGVTRFIPGRITLEGTFFAGELEEDGYVTSLYRLKTKALPR